MNIHLRIREKEKPYPYGRFACGMEIEGRSWSVKPKEVTCKRCRKTNVFKYKAGMPS